MTERPTTTRAPTRTPEYEARLRKRYASERRFRVIGLSAIVFSLSVLAFLLVSMTLNGIGGFQRAELSVTVDFTEAGLAGDASTLSGPTGVSTLEAQGLPDIVSFYAEQALGAGGAAAAVEDDHARVVAHVRLTRGGRPRGHAGRSG